MATIKSIFQGIFGLKKDPNATTQDVAVIKVEDTNAGLVLNPNGTGAIMRKVPNGSTGGNARGLYATDFGINETHIPENVASGDYSFAAGNSSRASGKGSVAFGSNRCLATQEGAVAMGTQSEATGLYSIAIGVTQRANQRGAVALGGYFLGNTASGFASFVVGESNTVTPHYSAVIGGQSNTASTGTHATVVGGQSNTSSGTHSISGGLSSTASGQRAIAFGAATASGQFSLAIGDAVSSSGAKSIALGADSQATQSSSVAIGNAVFAQAENSFASGNRSFAYLLGQNSRANGRFVANGDAQQSYLTARKSDTLNSAGTTVLSLDGTGTTNLIIPNANNRAWNVTVKWVAVCTATGSGTTAVGDVAIATDSFMFKRVGGASSIGTLSNLQNSQDATMAGATCAYAVGGSQDLQISFTAPASANATTFRVVAKVELTEVAW